MRSFIKSFVHTLDIQERLFQLLELFTRAGTIVPHYLVIYFEHQSISSY